MLKLKSQVKGLFTEAGLSEFTIGRNYDSYLAIVGPCGKEIIEVTNFSVGSKLTNEERKIAIEEYIIPTLTKHSKVIIDMIKFRQIELDAEQAVAVAIGKEKAAHGTTAHATKYGYGIDSYSYTSSIIFSEKDDNSNQTIYIKVEQDSDGIMDSTVKSIGTVNLVRGTKVAVAMMNRLKKINALYEVYIDARKEFIKAELSMKAECSL